MNESAEIQFHGVISFMVPERNYGVIVTADGLEVFFLRSSVLDMMFDSLQPGNHVRFSLISGILGLQAKTVFH